MNDNRQASDYVEASYTPNFWDFDQPESSLIQNSVSYHEACSHLLVSLKSMITFMHDRGYSKSPTLWGIIFAIGHPLTAGKSMIDIAREIRCTKACLSKIATEFIDATGLPPSQAMKSEEARNTYKQTNRNIYGRKRNDPRSEQSSCDA